MDAPKALLVRLSPELHDAIARVADVEGRSMAEVMRVAFRRYLAGAPHANEGRL